MCAVCAVVRYLASESDGLDARVVLSVGSKVEEPFVACERLVYVEGADAEDARRINLGVLGA